MHKKSKPKPGPLAKTIQIALQQVSDQKAAGASREERVANLERTLRAAWPRRREEPWHYSCDHCSDTGWEPRECPERPCGRRTPHLPHAFVAVCSCAKGAAVQGHLDARRPQLNPESAGKRRSFSRMGR